MLEYIDPSLLDWSDSFNPFTTTSTQEWRNESNFSGLQDSLMQAIRQSNNYTTRLQVIPDGSYQSVAARASFEEQFSVKPGSFLIGISASSSQPEGFKVQLKDLGTNSNFFSQLTSVFNLANGDPTDLYPPCRLLVRPRACPSGFISAQVVNQSANANAMQLVLWFAEPLDAAPTTTASNGKTLHGLGVATTSADQTLQTNIYQAQMVPRSQGGLSAPSGNTNQPIIPVDPGIMPIGGRPFLYFNSITDPTPGAGELVVVSFKVPPATNCAITEVQNIYTGAGFIPGSGDLVWRIAVDGTFLPGFDNIKANLGTNGFHRLAGPIQAVSGQTVEYRVEARAGAVLGGEVTCGLQGFFSPAQ